MADRLKDNEDLKLETLFRSESVPDDGFSERVIKRVRRRMWVQRLSLPTAIAIGTIIAAKPMVELVSLVPKIMAFVPQNLLELVDLPVADLFRGPTVVLGTILLAVMLMIGRMLEE